MRRWRRLLLSAFLGGEQRYPPTSLHQLETSTYFRSYLSALQLSSELLDTSLCVEVVEVVYARCKIAAKNALYFHQTRVLFATRPHSKTPVGPIPEQFQILPLVEPRKQTHLSARTGEVSI